MSKTCQLLRLVGRRAGRGSPHWHALPLPARPNLTSPWCWTVPPRHTLACCWSHYQHATWRQIYPAQSCGGGWWPCQWAALHISSSTPQQLSQPACHPAPASLQSQPKETTCRVQARPIPASPLNLRCSSRPQLALHSARQPLTPALAPAFLRQLPYCW